MFRPAACNVEITRKLPQMKALMSRTMTRANGRSADGNGEKACGAIARRDRGARHFSDVVQRRPRASNSSDSSEDVKANEAGSSVSEESAPFGPETAKFYNGSDEICRTASSAEETEEFLRENGSIQVGTSPCFEVGDDAVRVEQGKVPAGRVVDQCRMDGEQEGRQEQAELISEGLKSEETINDPDRLVASLTGFQPNESTSHFPLDWIELPRDQTLANEEDARSGKQNDGVGNVKGAERGERGVVHDAEATSADQTQVVLGASAVWKLVKDVFLDKEINDAADVIPRLSEHSEDICTTSPSRHTHLCAVTNNSNGVHSVSDYGPLVGLQGLNASSGENLAPKEEEGGGNPRIHTSRRWAAGRGPDFSQQGELVNKRENEIWNAHSERNSERLDAIERQREVEHREIQILRREVQELRSYRQRAEEIAHMVSDSQSPCFAAEINAETCKTKLCMTRPCKFLE